MKNDFNLYLREAFLAIGLVFLLLGSMWLATGMFPPMVVVESGSMKHSEDGSLGAIDPGDLVLIMNQISWHQKYIILKIKVSLM